MDKFQKILIAIISLCIGIVIVLLFRKVIVYASPIIIGYILYKLFTEEDWQRTSESLKVLFSFGTVIDEVYLIRNDGILLSHYTRRLKPHVDQDIVAGMLKSITNFVKEAFPSSGPTKLNEIKFKDTEIQIAKGRLVTLAVIISGKDKEGVRNQMKKCVESIEKNNWSTLKSWSGEMEDVRQLELYIEHFIRGRYSPASSAYKFIKKKVTP